MKTGSITGAMFLGLCAIFGCAGVVHAQDVGIWHPFRLVPGVSVVTTNGITYAEYTWVFGGCEEVDKIGPLFRKGNDFSFDFEIEKETGVPCPMFAILEHTNVVLGALAPGTYTLITTSWNVPVGTNIFTIGPVLRPIGFQANGSFQMQLLNGDTNASYVLQCSTNFVDWTSLSTNSAGQPLTDNCPVLPNRRFYRVQILKN